MASDLWHVTLKDTTRGPRRRTVLGVTFDLGTPDGKGATKKMRLAPEQKAFLEDSGDYTFRPAAASTGEGPLAQTLRPPAAVVPGKAKPAPAVTPAPTPEPETPDKPESEG